MARSLVIVLAILFAACGSKKQAAVQPTQPTTPAGGRLALDVEPTDAEVEVDGTLRGKASELRSLELASGPHQIVIRKPGFEIWRGEVVIETQSETIQVRLVPAKK
ncbi:MAG: PEGA domain-containing protein [Deltaproteobacteria bacterium]|nr:PEGA domain-containing protein [Deltaproteobacteria bacterium]